MSFYLPWNYPGEDILPSFQWSCNSPLPEGGLLQLFPDEVVPAIASLPDEAHLVAEDGQVADKTYSRHCPRAGGLLLVSHIHWMCHLQNGSTSTQQAIRPSY